MEQSKILVVGAGISGAVMAERYASIGQRVRVIDKRDHIGGNCYDFETNEGILVPKYGPHFFHTNDEGVWEYVHRFSEWRPYEHRVLSSVDGTLVPVPVNIMTVNTLFGLSLQTPEDMEAWLAQKVIPVAAPQTSEDSALSRVGLELYEKLFKPYTKKQWNLWPRELDASVMNRIPVRTSFDDRYFSDTYQAVPKYGYTKLFERMLDNPLIDVQLTTSWESYESHASEYEKIFFTGPIDQFFSYRFGGKLQYRSLRFEYETHDIPYYQSRAQINYPSLDIPYTRITEPKHATGQEHAKTVILKEYSTDEGEPYYPVPNAANQELYERYQKEAQKLEEQGIYFVGRLANYKYFNMDQAFRNALDLFEKVR